ncbi:Ppx/GppA family phosphatase [Evansella sp. AB-P1]|uniref:Ppx/GppA family phosphatase n=1 Tax=Evansella sp. AB-P1 TaxID=3037653 RepID=UPI00241D0348|nr:Ppx/GppA family phosphatase [Evansella sp. AB-P1]MDG5788774.1 Ppx/GppA family phosphatase [Evansella sp. AB-P1]
MKNQQIGIIDMGSNSIRFVVYDINKHGCIKEIQNLKVVARLSTYINDNGEMTNQGIQLILHTLQRFSYVAKNYQLTTIRGVATAAIRNAKNQKEILDAIKVQGAFNIEVLSEEEEAYYGYLAVTNSTDLQNGITIDIGGGSTEITLFENRKLIHSHSFSFGALTLQSFIQNNDQPSETDINELKEFLKAQYSILPWLKGKKLPVIGIGGSARNIASVHQSQTLYPLSGLHQYNIEDIDVLLIINKLNKMTLKQRQQLDGLSKDRADIIIPAATAIEQLISYVGANSFIISNKGLRDGIFSEIYLEPIGISHFPNVAEESIYQLSIDYSLNIDSQRNIAILSAFLASELKNYIHPTLTKKDLKLLQWSSRIYYLGKSIHPESKSQHTFYLLTNQTIDGLSHRDRLAIACIASFKSRSQLKQYIIPFRNLITKEDEERFELLGAILKLCYALNISDRNVIQSIQLKEFSQNKCSLEMLACDDVYFEKFQALKTKKHLEKALGKEIDLIFTDNFDY